MFNLMEQSSELPLLTKNQIKELYSELDKNYAVILTYCAPKSKRIFKKIKVWRIEFKGMTSAYSIEFEKSGERYAVSLHQTDWMFYSIYLLFGLAALTQPLMLVFVIGLIFYQYVINRTFKIELERKICKIVEK